MAITLPSCAGRRVEMGASLGQIITAALSSIPFPWMAAVAVMTLGLGFRTSAY